MLIFIEFLNSDWFDFCILRDEDPKNGLRQKFIPNQVNIEVNKTLSTNKACKY